MIPRKRYLDNLALGSQIASIEGAIVECGVWRGGMIAGLARTLGPERTYVLLDSFEGLPKAQAIDGPAALQWQSDTSASAYLDNCSAELAEATAAMKLAGIEDADMRKGWFEDTVPRFAAELPNIALLRLDGDWYDSTMTCLVHLFPLVATGGLIIIDDYGTYDGCNRALHRYLANADRPQPIRSTPSGVAYIRKV